MIGLFLAAMRFQAQVVRREPDYLMSLVTIPLLTVAFLAIMGNAGRADLAPYAVMGAALMTIWATALFVSGELIDADRWEGTLEGVLAAPAPYQVAYLGRIATVTMISFLGLVESALIAWLVFGVTFPVPHAGLLVLTLACTAFSMVGTASIMAPLFVLARSARIFQNSLSYPFYLLGGTVVPVVLLPEWLRPVSNAIFLSWASDLLRDCLRAEEPVAAPARLGVIVGLGVLGFGIGHLLTRAVFKRVRENGSVGFA